MKFFIDTANLEQIREANALGVLDGVTTNPSLMAKEREFEIKSKNSKLSVIDKLYVNGGLFFKKAVCRDSRQGVGYKVTE